MHLYTLHSSQIKVNITLTNLLNYLSYHHLSTLEQVVQKQKDQLPLLTWTVKLLKPRFKRNPNWSHVRLAHRLR